MARERAPEPPEPPGGPPDEAPRPSTRRQARKSTGPRKAEGSGGSREARLARSRRLVRRHPDIEVARLLVKRGFLDKPAAVEALRQQKARAQAGKDRVPFLALLVKRGVLPAERLEAARDEVRKHTYICDACAARAVILAGSQTRGGACPRCGAEIQVEEATDPAAVPPPRDFQDDGSATEPWRGPARPGAAGDDALAPGKVAFGKYRIDGELGRGAMGVVYRAHHLELGKDVALKVLVPTGEDEEHQVARFRREAAAVMKLRHEHIIAVHDFGGQGGLYYLTMDLVEGGDSLHRALKRADPPLPLRRRLEVLAQVARAVGHAHARGIVHRDLKPANVLLDPEGAPRVADFGLAKDEEAGEGELTRTHDRLGTPLFMAPEQIRRGAASVDGRADVWALGVMLFVAATGRYPFRSRTVMDLYLRILREGPDWSGTRYSAPDRASAFRAGLEARPGPGAPPSAPTLRDLDSTERGSQAAAAAAPFDEKTEVDAELRGADGALPKTLPLERGSSRGGRGAAAPAGAAAAGDAPRPAPELPLPPPFAPPPELEGQEVPRELRAVIEQALAKDPDERYATAELLAEDLERWLAGRPVSARGPGLLRRLRRALATRRVLAPAAAALLLVAVGLGAAAFAVGARAGAERRRAEARRRVDALWETTGAQERFAEFEAALVKEPEGVAGHPAALVRRGVARARQLRFDAARVDLQGAVERAVAAPDAELAAWARVELAAVELMGGRPAAALGAALAATAVGAPDARALLLLGHAAHAAGDPAGLEAADARVAAGLGAPGAPPELVACAVRLALRRGRPGEAAARLPAAAPDEPSDLAWARAHLALAVGSGDFEALLARAREGTWGPGKLRGDVKFMNNEGYTRMIAGDVAGAVVADRAAAALAPWHPTPCFYLARLLVWQGDLEGAAAALREALDRDPLHDGALDLLGAAAAAPPGPPGPALDEALARAARAAALAPGQAGPRLAEAGLRLRRGEALAAWDACERAEAAGAPARRTALLRAAALRLAGEVEAAALRERAGGRDADALEAGWQPRSDGEAAVDLVPVACAALARAGAAGAARVRERLEACVEALGGGDQPGRSLGWSADLAHARARALRARARAAAGDVDGALADLRWFGDGTWARDRWRPPAPWPPELTPAALLAAPELARVKDDPRGASLVEALRARGR